MTKTIPFKKGFGASRSSPGSEHRRSLTLNKPPYKLWFRCFVISWCGFELHIPLYPVSFSRYSPKTK